MCQTITLHSHYCLGCHKEWWHKGSCGLGTTVTCDDCLAPMVLTEDEKVRRLPHD